MELSSTTGLLRGMRFPKGKYPGHRVVKEVWKPKDSRAERIVVFYGGQKKRMTRRETAELARDRGFDLSFQKFRSATPEVRVDMLGRSLKWQRKAKKRWKGKLRERIGQTTNKRRRKDLEAQLERLKGAPIRSPLTGARPVSSYLRRFWA